MEWAKPASKTNTFEFGVTCDRCQYLSVRRSSIVLTAE